MGNYQCQGVSRLPKNEVEPKVGAEDLN